MATKEKAGVEIKPVQMESLVLNLVGDSPLIVHAWAEKARKEMLAKQMGQRVAKKTAKNPVADMATALYWMDGAPLVDYADWTAELFQRYATGARFGFPATAIKKAAISAAYRNELSKDKVSLQGAFFILGEGAQQLVEIQSPQLPEMREDMVKVGMGTSDLRYRPQFSEWRMRVEIRYNKNGKLSADDIANLIALGGVTCGIGEWRIERSGQYGTFHIE